LLLALLFLAEFGMNLALAQQWWGMADLHRTLVARLESNFGRSVSVGNFQLNLLGLPRLEANFIFLGEDPRFGSEFFLYAEKLTASLRWRSLFAGRIEFGTLALTRPSLNLVRLPTGQWNLESWLPVPSSVPAGPVSRPRGRLYRIKIDAGRVNFKRGPDKHPFAFVDVNGSVAQEAPGLWRLDIEAGVLRAGIMTQDAGLLRVTGRIGGTEARLRPADLRIEWEDASLADVLRLWRGQDYGVRGRISLDAAAQSGVTKSEKSPEGFAPWRFRATLRARGMHRWDLPPRPGDPALNLTVDAFWQPEEARLEFARAEVEAPASSLRATGFLNWSSPEGRRRAEPELNLRLTSAGIALNDAFAWYRAFRPGVSDAPALEGYAGMDVQLAGWPLRVEQGVVASGGGELRIAGVSVAARIGRFVIRADKGAFVLPPIVVTLAESGNAPRAPALLRAEGKFAPASSPGARLLPREGGFELSLTGEVPRIAEVLSITSPLGWSPAAAGWAVDGAADLKVRWEGSVVPFSARRTGTIELRNLAVRAPALSQPLQLASVRLELAPDSRRLTVASAQAFGARWSGQIARNDGSAEWRFVLAADRLEAAEIARWFAGDSGGLLRRFAGAAGAQASVPMARARGRIEVGQFWLRPLELRRVRGTLEFDGRTSAQLRLADATADFYGGAAGGTFEFTGAREPLYRFKGRLERVNLAALASAAPSLANRFAGAAFCELELSARGIGREALLRSLEGRGEIDVRSGEIRGLDLFSEVRAARSTPSAARARMTPFRTAAGPFAIEAGVVRVANVSLATAGAELDVSGTVDFAQALDLRVRESPHAVASADQTVPPSGAGRGIRIRGTLAAPQITPLESQPAPSPPAKARPVKHREVTLHKCKAPVSQKGCACAQVATPCCSS
jgi:hypothetical protein